MSQIAENVRKIRAQIDECARKAGRNPAEIQLCAATKMNDAAAVREAVAAGVDCCGENRVQELLEKYPQGAYDGVPLHFIGRLQTNKVKYLVGKVALIQSVDRIELLDAIEKQCQKLGVTQDILLEVNIAHEASKAGFAPHEVETIAAELSKWAHLRLKGLMAIPPVSAHAGDNFLFFTQMCNLFVDIGRKKYDNVSMECLSMGMSDDFADAIAAGSTMIRIGTAIFGARSYTH